MCFISGPFFHLYSHPCLSLFFNQTFSDDVCVFFTNDTRASLYFIFLSASTQHRPEQNAKTLQALSKHNN